MELLILITIYYLQTEKISGRHIHFIWEGSITNKTLIQSYKLRVRDFLDRAVLMICKCQ